MTAQQKRYQRRMCDNILQKYYIFFNVSAINLFYTT